jgi:hypothetical protein
MSADQYNRSGYRLRRGQVRFTRRISYKVVLLLLSEPRGLVSWMQLFSGEICTAQGAEILRRVGDGEALEGGEEEDTGCGL